MVRAESIILATFGVIVGVGLGIVFVWAMMSTASPGSDLDLDLTIPIWQLVIIAASAVVAAVVAAIPPSIHASRGRRPASDHHRMTTRTAESGTEVTSPSQESPAHPASPLVGSRDARKPLSTAAGGCTIRLSRWPCG